MTDTELKSCIGTIEMLRRLAYNIHGVMDVIDADNCEKIIKVLSDISKYKDAYNKGWDDGAKATYEHLKMCEEEQELCEDAISRQWLMECINEGWIKFDTEKDTNRFIHLIRDMAPSINPQEKTGHWIDTGSGQECSECHEIQYGYDSNRKYCANCGFRMIEPQESEGANANQHNSNALNALEGDAISRQKVLDMMQMRISGKELYKAVYELPPVNPQKPKTGHWVMPVQDDGMSAPIYYQVRCSECGFDLDPQTWHQELHQYGADKYCPNCGCAMKRE